MYESITSDIFIILITEVNFFRVITMDRNVEKNVSLLYIKAKLNSFFSLALFFRRS